MKKCHYHDPVYISFYYDGALDEEAEKKFSEHLLTCKECMGSLLNLEKDIFFMNTMKFEEPPERDMSRKAVFRLAADGFKLLKNWPGKSNFAPFVMLPAKGDEQKSAQYRMEKNNFIMDIKSEGDDLFTIELSGVSGGKVSLYKGSRLIEARSNIKEASVILYNLEKGSYSLVVENQDSIEFVVE